MSAVVDAMIGGARVGAATRFAVRDPATEQVLAEVADLPDDAVDAAVAAAAAAQPSWGRQPAGVRGELCAAIARAMLADRDRLAAMITAESGKPLAEAASEVAYAASFFSWFAGEAPRIYGEVVPAARADQRIVVERIPIGVCALVTPWNFPAAMVARKLAAALAAGNTAVIKPSELTPLTTLAIAELAETAGVPSGVINVATGAGPRVAQRLIADPRVRKVSFTGSTAVGRAVLTACAARGARATVELGGNAPFVVLADADLDRAVAAARVAKFRNAGQTCVAANRFIVDRAIAPAFTAAMARVAAGLRVGPGTEPGVEIGPLIDERAVAKVRRLVDDALDRGAELVAGASPGPGRWAAPIVLAGITPDMAVWREEIFGPVVAIREVDGEAAAIAAANDTDAGLCGYVMARDLAAAARVATALEVGMIGVNEGLISTAVAPFGGIKASGHGREGSRHGLDDYLEYKYVMTTALETP